MQPVITILILTLFRRSLKQKMSTASSKNGKPQKNNQKEQNTLRVDLHNKRSMNYWLLNPIKNKN
jgi:hypothetical protein